MLAALAVLAVLGYAWLRWGSLRTDPRAVPGASGREGTGTAGEPIPTRIPAPAHLVAVGDLHGDLAAARSALELAGVLGKDGHWTGGETVLVQTGDVIDRGDDERALLDLLDRLAAEARAAGGAVHLLLGNHELMNAAGDLRYVSPHGFAEFMDLPGLDVSSAELVTLPFEERPRAAAFRPGGPYARRLSEHPVALVVGDTVFVHGGLLPEHARHGIERLSQQSHTWLLGRSTEGRALVERRDSPVWVRTFGLGTNLDCAALQQMLDLVGATRLVVGHTTQHQGVSEACERRVWRIDVGMGSVPGAQPEVLDLSGGNVRPLRAAPAP